MLLQKLSGVAIFVSLVECGFSRLTYTGELTLHSHATKLGLRSTSSNAIIKACKTRNKRKRACAELTELHSRPQRPRSFWSAPRIATSGPVQRHSVFEWLWKHNRLRPEPIRFVRLDSEHAQSDGKSVNRGLPVLDQARGRDSWC